MTFGGKAKVEITAPFYHCKIARSGNTRYIAVSKILPEDWLLVRLKVVKLEGGTCVLEMTKLD